MTRDEEVNCFSAASLASDLARYAAMHAAAPELNCWREMMELHLTQLAELLGMSLVKKQREDA
ncbi:MAG TPA: hypothetical protein VK196_17050 [Magnetospirillum sp.]|nr:hypothetical protein [Magnetospirillum sp.]